MATGEFRRRHERKNYNTEVTFSYREKAYTGVLKDISMGGAFVTTVSAGRVGQGDEIVISIPYTSGSKHIKRRAKVLWARGDGFAVEFF